MSITATMAPTVAAMACFAAMLFGLYMLHDALGDRPGDVDPPLLAASAATAVFGFVGAILFILGV